MYVPNQYQYGNQSQLDIKKKNNNCFELLGFDILIDGDFRPWLLEVNLSPSLSTDSALDFKVKGALISDLFNLVGLLNDDMQMKLIQQNNYEAQTNGQGSSSAQEKGGKTAMDQMTSGPNSQSMKNGGIMKKTFLPKVFKQ